MLVCPEAAMETARVTVLSTVCSTAESAGSSAPGPQGHSLLAGVRGDRSLAPPLKAQHNGFTAHIHGSSWVSSREGYQEM